MTILLSSSLIVIATLRFSLVAWPLDDYTEVWLTAPTYDVEEIDPECCLAITLYIFLMLAPVYMACF